MFSLSNNCGKQIKAFLTSSLEKIQPIPKSNKTIARTSRTYKRELLAAKTCTTPKKVNRSLSFDKNKKRTKKNQTTKKKTKTSEEDEQCLRRVILHIS